MTSLVLPLESPAYTLSSSQCNVKEKYENMLSSYNEVNPAMNLVLFDQVRTRIYHPRDTLAPSVLS
jgi:hypothetical protein